MSRFIPPVNTDLSLSQLRNRMQDKISHLRERMLTIGSEAPQKLINSLATEIIATELRLHRLNEKASREAGE